MQFSTWEQLICEVKMHHDTLKCPLSETKEDPFVNGHFCSASVSCLGCAWQESHFCVGGKGVKAVSAVLVIVKWSWYLISCCRDLYLKLIT